MTNPVFPPFKGYIHDGLAVSVEREGFTLTATIRADDDGDPPWDREDGHGPVSEWTSRAKQPGERVLSKGRSQSRFYDFQAAVAQALADGWGCPGSDAPGLTAGQRAALAAEHDFKVLKAWCDDEWSYFGVVVAASRAGVRLGRASCWGIEGNYPNGDPVYFNEVAEDLAEEALDDARATIGRINAPV